MSNVVVGLGGTQDITTSGTDAATFLGAGTLNITGTPANPIDVILASVAGVGVLDVINLTDANVTLGGNAGVSALTQYNIGQGGTLRLTSTANVEPGSTITFTAPNSRLVLGSGTDLSPFSSIDGFGPGSSIDVSQAASGVSYADAQGANTGGVLSLLDGGGNVVATVPLGTGDYVGGNFKLGPDGSGGTLVQYAASVTSVTASPGTADLGAGQSVVVRVNTTDPVTVSGGTPSLSLDSGGVAAYSVADSTPGSLAFRYTVAPGQNSPDLSVTGVNLNGASLTDSAGQPVDLSDSVGNPAGTLQVDTSAPLVLGVTTSPGSGEVVPGQTVPLSVQLNEGVTVSGGTPTLALNNGGVATYDPTGSTPTDLRFTYQVQPGQAAADLAVTGMNLNGAAVADAAGNAADLSGVVTNPAGTLAVLDNFSYTDAVTNVSGTATGTPYTGPVSYLDWQYIWASPDAAAVRANVANAFVKGNSGRDALQVTGGSNVLDGGRDSNFLVGASGADSGFDTFYVDGRGGEVTWSTVVNFHQGDQATIFGFTAGLSTMSFTENEGADGYRGLTLHSELSGPQTGVNASFTFAGLDQATADAHFSITTGTLSQGTPEAVDYLLIQYNH